ncbi:MAG: beta-galactosidase [Candidatus Obscuribacterales bacterium]|nr:beta-galactosidase [Candidatus Obscuribacterales bacterium]
MDYSRIRAISLAFLLAGTTAASLPAATLGKNRAVEYLKYFDPMPQKNFLNESQDRIIKKRSFKPSELPNTPAVQNPELGFFAIMPADKLSDLDLASSLLQTKYCNGLSALIPWKTLEPGEEKYDWTTIDKLLELCQKNKKTLILRVSTCGIDLPTADEKISSDTPQWVFESGAKSIKYIDKNGNTHLMPVFWDQTYLAAFSNFISEMGSRYDMNPLIHSVGITGGGFGGGTSLVPTVLAGQKGSKTDNNESGFRTDDQIEDYMRKDLSMTQKQIVDHWKYVADLFPQAFPNTSLNLAINPPTPNRAGEDALDEISDYLVYRYGQHVYVTRQGLKNGKHGFDDYRVLLKFRPDTYAGLSLLPTVTGEDMTKIAQTALDDGICYIELPPELLTSQDTVVQHALEKLACHMGYQLISQKAVIDNELAQGEPLNVELTFLNVGDATPKRPVRELDKDVPSSYKVMIELKDSSGKAVAQILHTPETKTESWKSGQPVSWKQALRMPTLNPGEYEASMAIYDPNNKKRLQVLDGRSADNVTPAMDMPLGKIRITAATHSSKTGGTLESMK